MCCLRRRRQDYTGELLCFACQRVMVLLGLINVYHARTHAY